MFELSLREWAEIRQMWRKLSISSRIYLEKKKLKVNEEVDRKKSNYYIVHKEELKEKAHWLMNNGILFHLSLKESGKNTN